MSQLLTSYPLSIYSIISISIFLSIFAVITFWTFGVETKDSLDRKAMLPFNDEEPKQ